MTDVLLVDIELRVIEGSVNISVVVTPEPRLCSDKEVVELVLLKVTNLVDEV